MLLYYGFWHTALYGLHWASRPFAQGRVYRWSKTFHNMWYCLLGCWQWTAWEMIMVYLYATGRIGYQADHEILASWKDIANFWACIILVPFFREVHFFFAHRFIHLRCLYKYIHALHHRNTDIEPFSGLCMSPSEHLYYFSSIAPSVYWHASPFQFLWNGIHLLLSPGAAHSGVSTLRTFCSVRMISLMFWTSLFLSGAIKSNQNTTVGRPLAFRSISCCTSSVLWVQLWHTGNTLRSVVRLLSRNHGTSDQTV